MRPPEEYLQKLRDAGLYVQSYSEEHAYRGAVRLWKPKGVPGNCIEGKETHLCFDLNDNSQDIVADAPTIVFGGGVDDGRTIWWVQQNDCAGGLGEGEFCDVWSSAEEAVLDILDYYFGNPRRMQQRADALRRLRERAAEYDRLHGAGAG